MSQYDDEAEVEQLKRWLRENSVPMVAGLVLGFGGIFGYQAWEAHKTQVAERASRMYEEMKGAATAANAAEAQAIGTRLMQEYGGTPYAAQAGLLLAQQAADAGDWGAADRHLAWVVRNSDDEGIKALARLRRARVLWQQGQPEEALALLKYKAQGEFAALFAELRGDIRHAQGDRAAARQEYEQALKLGVAPANTEYLQRKLDDLADVTAARS